ncbi:MAG: chaperone modulator CbpM [Candidatus Competibacteraceae bacterium]
MRRDLTAFTGTILDDNVRISLRELCQICGVNAERIMDMVDEGVLEPSGTSPPNWRFGGRSIVRLQIALRLQRDLRVNLAGTALVLDLLEEVEELRRLIRSRRL